MVSLPESVEKIGKGAFAHSGISLIKMGKNVDEIDEDAFYDCEKLYTIDIPNSVTVIEEGAFWFCDNLTLVSVPKGLDVTICVEDWVRIETRNK